MRNLPIARNIYFFLSLGEDILDPRSDSEMIAESRTIHSLNSTKMERSVFVIERHRNDKHININIKGYDYETQKWIILNHARKPGYR